MRLLLQRKKRWVYIVASLLLFLTEVFIERFVHDGFVRPYLGDFLVVILIYTIIMALTRFKVLLVAVFTLVFSYAIEIAQYLEWVVLLGLEDETWARIVMGTRFSWWDLWMYTLGILFVILVERWTSIEKAS